MKRINMKRDYILPLPHFIHIKKSFFIEHHRWLLFLYKFTLFSKFALFNFFFFAISPFRSNHRKCSIKKLFLKFCNIDRKTPMLESLFIKFKFIFNKPADLLKRDSNAALSPWILLFSYCIDNFSKNDYKRKNVTPIKTARASS